MSPPSGRSKPPPPGETSAVGAALAEPGTKAEPAAQAPLVISVRRIHRRDLNRTWEFLKLVFRDVNRETVEYQRPRSKSRFLEVYEEEGVEQLLFECAREQGADEEIVGYAECAFEITGSDNWMNERYFDKRDMRPLYVEELAVHPDYHGRGIGGFILEQLEHLARVRGCTHLVLEVAENNKPALTFYKARSFYKLDAAIFMAKRIPVDAELLPPRKLESRRKKADDAGQAPPEQGGKPASKASGKASGKPAPGAIGKASAKAGEAAGEGAGAKAGGKKTAGGGPKAGGARGASKGAVGRR